MTVYFMQYHRGDALWCCCRDNFTREEAEGFVTEALALAMASDCSSGGCIRLVTVDATGAHHKYIKGDEVPYPDMPPLEVARMAGMVIG
jgi:20S proteasome subunit beta 1